MQISWKYSADRIAWLTDRLMLLVVLIRFCFSNSAASQGAVAKPCSAACSAPICSVTKAIGMQSTRALLHKVKTTTTPLLTTETTQQPHAVNHKLRNYIFSNAAKMRRRMQSEMWHMPHEAVRSGMNVYICHNSNDCFRFA